MINVIVWVLSLGLPLKVTDMLMENSPLLAVNAKWIVWLERFLPPKFTRRALSFLIPLVVSSAVVACAVLIKALAAPVSAEGWLELIYTYSGIAAILPQFAHALKAES